MPKRDPDHKTRNAIAAGLGWFALFAAVATIVFWATSWYLLKFEESRRPTPKIRIEPAEEYESHPVRRPDLDRG